MFEGFLDGEILESGVLFEAVVDAVGDHQAQVVRAIA
jgi:hypothetical protein